jgi:hypothetical protein
LFVISDSYNFGHVVNYNFHFWGGGIKWYVTKRSCVRRPVVLKMQSIVILIFMPPLNSNTLDMYGALGLKSET